MPSPTVAPKGRKSRRAGDQSLPPVAPDSFASSLRAIQDRLTLSDDALAAYLGVPVTTVRHWLLGDRAPGFAVLRLVEVLGLVEAMAPALHAALMPENPLPKRVKS